MKNVFKYDEFVGTVNESRYETGRVDKYHNREYNWKVVFDDLKKVVLGRKKMTKPLYQALCHFTIAHYNMWGWIDYYNGNWGELASELNPHPYGDFDASDRAPFDDIQNFLNQHSRNTIQSPYESVSNENGAILNEGLVSTIKAKSRITKVQAAVFDKASELIEKNPKKYKDGNDVLRDLENDAKKLYEKELGEFIKNKDIITADEWWKNFSKSAAMVIVPEV